MKKVFCMIAANGSGKTAVIKTLIAKHQWMRVKIFGDETWDVIAPPWVNGNKSPEDKALIVGLYEQKKIGGGDRLERETFWAAMRVAAEYKGTNRIIVEALKLTAPDYFHKLESFCRNSDFTLHTTLIKVDPMVAYKRHVLRAAPAATYPIEKVMERHTRARYLYEIIQSDQKAVIDNSRDGETAIEDAAAEYLKVVFPD